jgi:hypothetical protein
MRQNELVEKRKQRELVERASEKQRGSVLQQHALYGRLQGIDQKTHTGCAFAHICNIARETKRENRRNKKLQ